MQHLFPQNSERCVLSIYVNIIPIPLIIDINLDKMRTSYSYKSQYCDTSPLCAGHKQILFCFKYRLLPDNISKGIRGHLDPL